MSAAPDAAAAAAPPPPAGVVSLSDEEKAERVAALKGRVASEVAGDQHAERFCTDATLERFTRAVNYDVDKASDFLRSTLKWRAEKQPWAVVCPGCAVNPRAHSLRCVGTDAAGRPVLYHSFAQAEGRHVSAHNVAHLQRILEDCVTYMDAQQPPVSQWVWVFDFHGYSLWDNNPTTVVSSASFLPMHPNRLFKVVMVDAPAAFSTLFSMASSFLTDITKAKITFLALDQLRPSLAPWAGDDIAAWLVAECQHNRALAAKGGQAACAKRYWEAPAQRGQEGGDGSGENGSAAAVHDPRGLASFVESREFFSPVQWSPLPAVLGDVGGGGEGPGGEAPRGDGGATGAPAQRSGSWLWGNSS
jgi:hypothetical protein